MVLLRDLRMQRRWTIPEMASALDVSPITISRIERAERQSEKHPMDEKLLQDFLSALSHVFNHPYILAELEGVRVAPPRPGRPKKQREE